jgi:hypothetical protein
MVIVKEEERMFLFLNIYLKLPKLNKMMNGKNGLKFIQIMYYKVLNVNRIMLFLIQ